jgi:hypothetical protein
MASQWFDPAFRGFPVRWPECKYLILQGFIGQSRGTDAGRFPRCGKIAVSIQVVTAHVFSSSRQSAPRQRRAHDGLEPLKTAHRLIQKAAVQDAEFRVAPA